MKPLLQLLATVNIIEIANLLTTSGALIFIIKVESRLTKLETHLFHLLKQEEKKPTE